MKKFCVLSCMIGLSLFVTSCSGEMVGNSTVASLSQLTQVESQHTDSESLNADVDINSVNDITGCGCGCGACKNFLPEDKNDDVIDKRDHIIGIMGYEEKTHRGALGFVSIESIPILIMDDLSIKRFDLSYGNNADMVYSAAQLWQGQRVKIILKKEWGSVTQSELLKKDKYRRIRTEGIELFTD